MNKRNFIALFSACLLFGAADSRGDIGPVALTIIGMGTVFLGLIIMNLFINLLKSAVNPAEKPEKKKAEPASEKRETEAESILLTDDELYAVALAVHMENELNYSVSDETLTINWRDKDPSWFRIRR